MIGIVSHPADLHATEVRRHLDARGAAHSLVDTSQLPASARLTTTQADGDSWSANWSHGGVEDDPAAWRAMWWRRPQPFVIDPAVRDPQDRGFVIGECAAAVAGLWSCTDAVWVNDPDRDEAASRKMWQLKLAASLGLRVPRTCMTNDPQRAREFIASEPGAVIYKSFSATPQTWRETRTVGPGDEGMLDLVRFAPVIFQEAIPGGVDIRVTIVDGQLFAARISAGSSGYEYDFRIDPTSTITEYQLPEAVEGLLLDLMARLDLWYGAVDLRLAPDGRHVFLEVNPAGQWLFVELATGQPISAALADLLVRLDSTGDPHRRPAPATVAVPDARGVTTA